MRSKLAFAIRAEPGRANEGEKGKNIIGQEWWRDSLNFPGSSLFLIDNKGNRLARPRSIPHSIRLFFILFIFDGDANPVD